MCVHVCYAPLIVKMSFHSSLKISKEFGLPESILENTCYFGYTNKLEMWGHWALQNFRLSEKQAQRSYLCWEFFRKMSEMKPLKTEASSDFNHIVAILWWSWAKLGFFYGAELLKQSYTGICYMISTYFSTTESFFLRYVMEILSFSLGPWWCILMACLNMMKTIL